MCIIEKKYIIRNIFIAFALVFLLTGNVLSQIKEDKVDLKDLFSSKKTEMPDQQIIQIAFEFADNAFPVLEQAIENQDKHISGIARESLMYIGGPKAVYILEEKYKATKDLLYKKALCFAMSSTGRATDIEYLIDALEAPRFGSKALVSRAAMYSLAVLNSKQAVEPLKDRLKQLLKDPPGTIPEELKFALDRIQGKIWKVIYPQTDNNINNNIDQGEIIFTVLQFGIPYGNMSNVFFFNNANTILRRSDNAWYYDSTKKRKNNRLPSISFDVFITKDGLRSICSVSIVYGNTCGYGFDYILKRNNNGWRVTGLIPTWVL